MHEETDMAASMHEAGAVAYLTKGGPTEHLIAVIRACRPEASRVPL
jgi:DNA-binding NarL/FixJ family response regulator